MRPLSVLSFNVRGLTSQARRVRTRLLIESLRASPDIICLQEHKLRLGKTERIQQEVWAQAHWVCAPASEGIHSSRNANVEAGKGGVAIGVHRDHLSFLVSEGTVPSNRAAWLCFVHPIWGKIGFAGVYGPNDPVGRAALWTELSTSLDIGFHVLDPVGGLQHGGVGF